MENRLSSCVVRMRHGRIFVGLLVWKIAVARGGLYLGMADDGSATEVLFPSNAATKEPRDEASVCLHAHHTQKMLTYSEHTRYTSQHCI